MEAVGISNLDIFVALPEIALAVGAMLMLMGGVFEKNHERALFGISKASLLIIVSALGLMFFAGINTGVYFNDLFLSDGLSYVSKIMILASGALVLVLTNGYFEKFSDRMGFEYPILILLSLCGMMIMVSSADLMTLYLGLELQSLSLYVMAAIRRDEKISSEAGMKYFVLGALASGILLYGCSFIYGYTGSTNIAEIASVVGGMESYPQGLIVGMVLLVVGLAFKISAAPFHMWTPDVYEGVPTPVTAYFAIVPKLAAAVVMVRILAEGLGDIMPQWQELVMILAVVSMVLGAFAGVWQKNIKRLLAYSSIANMGYALVAVAAASEFGNQAMLAFFVIYMITSVALFAVILSIWVREKEHEGAIQKLEHLGGFAKTNPVLAGTVALLMISMIGLPFPPFAGFWGKFFVFKAAVDSGLFVLAVIGVVSSVVAAFYYLKIIKIMYFDEAPKNLKIVVEPKKEVLLIIFVLAFISTVIFFFPSILMSFLGEAVVNILP